MAKTKYKKDSKGFYNTTIRLSDGSRKHICAKTVEALEAQKERYENLAPGADTTLHDYAVRWFAAHQQNWKLKTKEMYSRMVDVYICNPQYGIGNIRLADLRPMQVQELLMSVRNAGDASRTMGRTCEQVLITMRQIERSAQLDGLVKQPFTAGVGLPRVHRSRRRALNRDEQAAVFAADLQPMDRCLLFLLYGCGLRRGEALALRAEDIDLEARTVTVTKNIVFTGNDPTLRDAPKTESGFRSVPIPAAVYAPIRDYVETVGSGQLFPGRYSKLITQIRFRRMWDRIILAMQRTGAPCVGLTPHIFRHNYATQLYYSDVSILQAADLLGHADASMITHVYAHLDREKEQLNAKIDSAFAPQNSA